MATAGEEGAGKQPQRRMSTASNAALQQLASYELKLSALESETARLALALGPGAAHCDFGQARADIAATHGAVEKLQMNSLDSIMTGHLVSGKADAKGSRKSLTQRAESLVTQLIALNKAAASPGGAAAFATASTHAVEVAATTPSVAVAAPVVENPAQLMATPDEIAAQSPRGAVSAESVLS